MDDLKGKLISIIVDKLGIDEAHLKDNFSKSFKDTFDVDSLDFLEIIMEIEKEFDILISDDEAMLLTTPQQAYDYLLKATRK